MEGLARRGCVNLGAFLSRFLPGLLRASFGIASENAPSLSPLRNKIRGRSERKAVEMETTNRLTKGQKILMWSAIGFVILISIGGYFAIDYLNTLW